MKQPMKLVVIRTGNYVEVIERASARSLYLDDILGGELDGFLYQKSCLTPCPIYMITLKYAYRDGLPVNEIASVFAGHLIFGDAAFCKCDTKPKCVFSSMSDEEVEWFVNLPREIMQHPEQYPKIDDLIKTYYQEAYPGYVYLE